MIAIVDYGVGNIRSVERALVHVGAEVSLTSAPDDLAAADGVVLPGVGAFAPALARLIESGLGSRIVELSRLGKPVLGVCLGYQLLFEESTEHGRHAGLGLLPGRVVEVAGTSRLPVIGWCRVTQTGPSPLWDGVPDHSYFYFVHSFTPSESEHQVGCSDHSPAAAAAYGNVMGTQFHPEKSGADGLRLYANFVALCG
ncbi:MAG: imidazole glycerol phosphate synthase subunit HisH [Chloroflexi bacterium]|nr:MAG: imidazole glycerol phosphate synthase, glutamine amidotransferase subunit [Actinobacteria bacterium 13_1_40CM_3_66_19]TMF82001.1 MAG: imidazole glycerol phosphate synthase subunit HisH [Chloroflexota bacterium]TMG11639.1 MAG: imidazole glycerol phosphate synthase subunit HisH [Chloroflexota bacterium]